MYLINDKKFRVTSSHLPKHWEYLGWGVFKEDIMGLEIIRFHIGGMIIASRAKASKMHGWTKLFTSSVFTYQAP